MKYNLVLSEEHHPDKVKRALQVAAQSNSFQFKIKPKSLVVYGVYCVIFLIRGVNDTNVLFCEHYLIDLEYGGQLNDLSVVNIWPVSFRPSDMLSIFVFFRPICLHLLSASSPSSLCMAVYSILGSEHRSLIQLLSCSCFVFFFAFCNATIYSIQFCYQVAHFRTTSLVILQGNDRIVQIIVNRPIIYATPPAAVDHHKRTSNVPFYISFN